MNYVIIVHCTMFFVYAGTPAQFCALGEAGGPAAICVWGNAAAGNNNIIVLKTSL